MVVKVGLVVVKYLKFVGTRTQYEWQYSIVRMPKPQMDLEVKLKWFEQPKPLQQLVYFAHEGRYSSRSRWLKRCESACCRA